ncbi:serine/arginine repetitive matrix protein 2 [Nocardioides caldifontis]|uniref:serine/arginine repetitive matrix protein 2 n=1 Tax=Nocardioides caldifontis TaxID=2588938 RepID=UPI0011DF3AAE|nr:serine/arginine repetitive matrix protein 2 [Nocardioides caldifontis]
MTHSFTTSDGLRAALDRLHRTGGWVNDPEAEQLMRFAMHKYGALARKHRLEPEDAAAAAFEVMRTRAARTARDPWGVVTRAVQVTLIAEDRANGLLCSPSQARRAHISAHHDAQRFSDRDAALLDYHPAFRVAAEQDHVDGPTHIEPEPTGAYVAVDAIVGMFAALGWPEDTARATMEYVAARLIECGSRSTAHESLRRDHHARALLDLDRATWSTTLRVVLGNPHQDVRFTSAGHGILLRLLVGQSVAELLEDDHLVDEISCVAPRNVGARHA